MLLILERLEVSRNRKAWLEGHPFLGKGEDVWDVELSSVCLFVFYLCVCLYVCVSMLCVCVGMHVSVCLCVLWFRCINSGFVSPGIGL